MADLMADCGPEISLQPSLCTDIPAAKFIFFLQLIPSTENDPSPAKTVQ
jgi:hypothetical protein